MPPSVMLSQKQDVQACEQVGGTSRGSIEI